MLAAITSLEQRLKQFPKIPPNGLAMFCGNVEMEEGKEKKVNISFEPLKPIPTTLYLCDNRFHTESLAEVMFAEDDPFGFIIMDGNGCLFATVQGSARDVLFKFSVDLPKKHGRGGQSALRFARLRLEKRHNFLRRCAELATQYFVDATSNKPRVKGLVLAGAADFKTALLASDLFDPRLRPAVLAVYDISYGQEAGLHQALEMAGDLLKNVRLVQEKRLLQGFFQEISLDSNRYAFLVADTLQALELGAVETLLLWEGLDVSRFLLVSPTSGEESVLHLNAEQEADERFFHEPRTGLPLEVREKTPLVDWLLSRYKSFGVKAVYLLTDRSPEGSQFARGFGGIGAMLRWPVDFLELSAQNPAPCDQIAKEPAALGDDEDIFM